MDSNLIIIDNIISNLEYNIGILIEALNKEEVVSLTNNDIFKSIINDIEELKKYDNKGMKELFTYYRFTLSHLNKTFNNKEFVKKDELSNVIECFSDLKTLKSKLNISIPYNKFFEDLKGVYRSLNSIKSEFTYNYISTDILKTYESIIIKYRNLISQINEIESYMSKENYDSLKIDLDINFTGFKDNLNKIYFEILKSNNDIAQPLMNKLKYNLINENYDSILKTSMVNKEINNYHRRYELSNNLDMLIESLNVIINRYKFKKVDKRDINIDIEYIDDNKQEDYGIEIPRFIEDNYENKKNSLKRNNSVYDRKIAAFIARFEILKRKLEKKNSLTKKEVKLYNKLESALDMLRNNNPNRFISSIKFNHYYKALNKKIKLSRKNSFKQVVIDNKKRK